jgi:hypothetical protein
MMNRLLKDRILIHNVLNRQTDHYAAFDATVDGTIDNE